MNNAELTHKHEVAYISGAISGDPNYKEKFNSAQMVLEHLGYYVLSPVMIPEEISLTYSEHMAIDLVMVQVADCIVLLPDYKESKGAMRELHRANLYNSRIVFFKGLDTDKPRW